MEPCEPASAVRTGRRTTEDTACPLCGKFQGYEMCSVRELLGRCGRPDPRLLESPITDEHDWVVKLLAADPNGRMAKALQGMLLVKRCGAHARTTGKPCQRLPLAGQRRCAIHGARSTGPRPKHAQRTVRVRKLLKAVHLGMQIVRATNQKPPRE